ncbi:MAG: phosphogluconate dehydrogenase C-terminal domain-containing protein [Bacteroidales bacterium]
MINNKVALIGAGGKMGLRLTRNLKKSRYMVSYHEVNEVGIKKLKEEFSVTTSDAQIMVPSADYVIFAVPDIALGSVTAQYIPQMKKGGMVVILDPAAALAGKLFFREDVAYFIAHPAHPSVFNWEPDEEAHRDYFGGIAARQAIVCALMHGSEENFERGAQLASTFYAPVCKVHKITVEQMGLLEPALVETLASTCIYVIRQALDEVVKRGVPEDAARDFLLGHLKIQLAVLFDMIPGAVFSDAANKALQRGLKEFIKDDWRKIFEPENVYEQIRAIT